ncbi:MAG TPA: methionine biosynthesis protein MetW [Methylophilaceae bacterium]|nr:methionine biosynthesis protein MetW [Methylophilaceae bacterium]
MNIPTSTNVNNTNLRKDFALITKWIQPETKVLDLGCGDGGLLTHLHNTLSITGYGVEKDDANWLAALQNGVDVIQMDLEAGLSGFEDQSFDTVILSQTLQAMHHTEAILIEMLRVGREAIVTFPNFGYWRNRIQITAGQMPVSKSLPYEWYNTPNVHLCTIHDFEALCKKHNISIIERNVITDDKAISFLPNLLGNLAMYRLRSAK